MVANKIKKQGNDAHGVMLFLSVGELSQRPIPLIIACLAASPLTATIDGSVRDTAPS